MGLFDFLTGTKRPAAGTPALSAEEVKKNILSVNRATAPFRIVDGKDEGADLIAEWKIVDAKWYEIFAKAGLKKVFRIYLKLHPETHEVRALDKEYSVEWRAGVPKLGISVKKFVGQEQAIEFGAGYAFTEELRPGEVYNYRFATKEIKSPVQKAVTDSGWTYKGVVPPSKL